MQVFLPDRSFKVCAETLDNKRLVKQLLEGRQILSALAGETKGWVNHPATKMFAGHEAALTNYLFWIAREMAKRGYKWENNWAVIANLYLTKFEHSSSQLRPAWMLDDRFEKVIATHRANLHIKAPELYPEYGLETAFYRDYVCCEDCNYYWPTHRLDNADVV
jgi:hypothetical protein